MLDEIAYIANTIEKDTAYTPVIPIPVKLVEPVGPVIPVGPVGNVNGGIGGSVGPIKSGSRAGPCKMMYCSLI
ncbi:hypothetical protein bcgnr5388_32010 [Bacillus cereus]